LRLAGTIGAARAAKNPRFSGQRRANNLSDFAGSVRGAVVDKYQFPLVDALSRDQRQRFRHPSFRIEHRRLR
jgi:hypothetical protein